MLSLGVAPTRADFREGFLDYLSGLDFSALATGAPLRSRLSSCKRYNLSAGCGRPARGEHFRDHYACGSRACPECAQGKRVARTQWPIKSRFRAFEAWVRRKFNLDRPLRYGVVTMTPPREVWTWWAMLAARALGVESDETVKDLARLHLGAATRFGPRGVYSELFGPALGTENHEMERGVCHAATYELLQLGLRTLQLFLDGQAGIGGSQRALETRYPIVATVHYLSAHGFYPHVVLVFPEWYQVKIKGKWEFRLLPSRVFQEYTVKGQLCRTCEPAKYADRPEDRKPCRACGRTADSGLCLEGVGAHWVSSVRAVGMGAWRERVPHQPQSRAYYERDPGVGVDVRIITDALEAVINYEFSAPLTKLYLQFCRESHECGGGVPASFQDKPLLNMGVKYVLRWVVMSARPPRLVAHTGVFASRVVGVAFAALAGRPLVPDGKDRANWSRELAITKSECDAAALVRRTLIDRLAEADERLCLAGQAAASRDCHEAWADLVVPSRRALALPPLRSPIVDPIMGGIGWSSVTLPPVSPAPRGPVATLAAAWKDKCSHSAWAPAHDLQHHLLACLPHKKHANGTTGERE